MISIAYQGVPGAFSHIAALQEFGECHTYVSTKSFKDVFEMVENEQANYGIVPLENSLVGSIYENYELLQWHKLKIVAERFTKIEHCFLTVPGREKQKEAPLKGIKKVMSHPKALEQCSSFFQCHPWIEAVVHTNTAAAAAEVAARNDLSLGAIASTYAAELYGLEICKIGIEDDPKNYTRFVTIAKKAERDDLADKCSLLIALKHVSGSLAEVLKLFASQSLNLTKIESRPLKGTLFEYVFYIDIEFKEMQRIQTEYLLKSLCTQVPLLKILGFYKKGDLWTG